MPAASMLSCYRSPTCSGNMNSTTTTSSWYKCRLLAPMVWVTTTSTVYILIFHPPITECGFWYRSANSVHIVRKSCVAILRIVTAHISSYRWIEPLTEEDFIRICLDVDCVRMPASKLAYDAALIFGMLIIRTIYQSSLFNLLLTRTQFEGDRVDDTMCMRDLVPELELL